MPDLALQVSGVTKSFTGVQVLHGLDFDVRRGEVLGLVGENGAGKSTLMNLIGGVLPMDAGRMTLFGAPYAPRDPAAAAARGIAFVHQELNLFANLTVAENLFIDGFPKTRCGAIDRREIRRAARQWMDRFGLPVAPDARVESLPPGIRQLVEIAKGLRKQARIMIFDEPTTSLSRREKDHLFKTIAELKGKGMSVIYISHILDDVRRICDRIAVLRDGRMVDTREAARFPERELIRCMVGREMTQAFPSVAKAVAETVLLEAQDIRWGGRVNGVSLALRAGELVGLYGLMGAGRTELANVLFGVERRDGGEVLLHAARLAHITPGACIGARAAYITEDRRREGLLMTKPVADSLGLVKMADLLNRWGVVNARELDRHNRRAIQDLRIKVADPATQLANSLSGGNQQKVVFGKWLVKDPKVFILDEPTRGVDVGARFEIYSIILRLAQAGSAVLFISSEMEELIGTCDRILVMSGGRITGEVPRAEFDPAKILELALPRTE